MIPGYARFKRLKYRFYGFLLEAVLYHGECDCKFESYRAYEVRGKIKDAWPAGQASFAIALYCEDNYFTVFSSTLAASALLTLLFGLKVLSE